MTVPATIYARFSNVEQAQGNSKHRQLTLCREMVARHGWLHDPERELVDEGKSAFSGANRAIGSHLYDFEQRAEAGLYRNGHVLVVENLDRISRQGYDAILPFLQKLTASGVTVATVDGERIYPAYERVQMVSVIEAVVKSELAREESEKKSRRLKAAQDKRVAEAVENAAKGLHISHTLTVPAWISVDRDSKVMTLNEERAVILREIFQLTIEGYGTPAIAKRLNARGEPVWGHLGQRSKNGWTVGYLTKLVLNRAVMGEYQPMNRPRHGEATPKDTRVLNHYPQAIDPATFARAQAARQSRKGTSGAWQISHANLFSGIAKCKHCGGRMKQEVTAKRGSRRSDGRNVYETRQAFSYLKCHNALNKVWDEERGQLRCDNRNWVRYEKLERAVLDVALHFAASQPRGDASLAVAEIEVQVAEAVRHITEKQRQADNYAKSFASTGSAMMERLALALEAEIADDRQALRLLEGRLDSERAAAPSPDHLESVEALRLSLDSEDDEVRAQARVGIKQTFGAIITAMRCDRNKDTELVLGDNVLGLVFNGEGEMTYSQVLTGEVHGPDGEPDWHPDRDYQGELDAREGL